MIRSGLRRAITLLAAACQIIFASIRLLGRSLSLAAEILLFIGLAATVAIILWGNVTPNARVGLVVGTVIMIIALFLMAYWSSRGARKKLPPRSDQSST